MVVFAYIIPILICLLLRFEYNYSGSIQAYLLIVLIGELTIGGFHWLFYYFQTTSTEYLGSLVRTIYREDAWTELTHTTETRTNSNGKTYTVNKIKEKYHREKYYFLTTLGTEFSTGEQFFNLVAERWAITYHKDIWNGTHIKGGKRYGIHYTIDDFSPEENNDAQKWIPITESHRYTDKIRKSGSIFKFEKITKKRASEYGLCDYPKITKFDAPCVISNDIPISADTDEMFRKFNARYASQWQMRLYILLFNASRGIGVSELQRAYWQGGHKNEFIICIGVTPNHHITWTRAFSWADSQHIEMEISQLITSMTTLNWNVIYNQLLFVLPSWKRKNFKDFNYINVTLELWQTALIFIVSLLESIIAINIVIS